ncbi:MAG: molybdopterin-dependent oxidoreductase, partial [Deltaproteobacteria bacterium]|nr:molybdopterin-dependent oxidoreductase [Deltaproteobacteria bacterium]
MTNSMEDIEKAEVILLTGSNPAHNHPVVDLRIRRAVSQHGAKLIVVDPRRTELVEYAHLWLRPRPGTDVAWLNGLMHIIIHEGLWDRSYVEARTENFSSVKATVERYNPLLVEKITGIPAG